jgi:DNA-binding response OmpR family regulator
MSARRVLIIDDNKDLADGLSELLEIHGHETDVALTGGAGVEAACNATYDVIFIDIGLPDTTGVDCAKRIREGGSRARIVFMTGYCAREIPAQISKLGDTQLLMKPIDPVLILELVG